MTGVCLDALNSAGAPSLEELRASGADGARLVAFNDDRFFSYQHMLERAGLTTAVVLARESFPDDDFSSWASWYAARCTPTWWVCGNEWDAWLLPEPSPSSWKMSVDEYAAFWHVAATGILSIQPHAQLVVGGMVAGQPSIAGELRPLLDPFPFAWDVHPYGRDAESAFSLLRDYRRFVAAPRLVLEWHRPADQIWEFVAMLAAETRWSCFFAWSDGMVPGFGLIENHATYEAFQQASTDAEVDMTLEQAEQQTDWPLGPRWNNTPISEWGNGERAGWYTYGVALQKGNDVYPLVGANVESFKAIAEKHGFQLIP